jgi:hypothetical protein
MKQCSCQPHVKTFLLVGLILFSLVVPQWAAAGPAIDCEGSAKAYSLQGIPCKCVNGQIVCSTPPKKSSGGSSKKGLSFKNQMKLQTMESVTDGVANAFAKWINGPTPQERREAEEAAAIAAAQAAAIEAENKKLQDQRAQAKHDKMMTSYKQIDGSNNMTMKSLPGSSLAYKTLDNGMETLAARARDSFADQLVRKEQDEFDNMNAEWMKKQKQLIEERLKKPNEYAGSLYKTIKASTPPLPWKTKAYADLKPGDVLLFEGKEISYADNKVSNGKVASRASHTVIYLREVNGVKLFMDNQPNEGPRIISEEQLLKIYSHRKADVATIAEPLNKKEGEKLLKAAVEMAKKNNKKLVDKDGWFGKYLPTDTNYGTMGENDVVCSEADWAIINAAGRTIAHSDNKLKLFFGLNFSPSDFYNSQYFLVTRLW